MEELGRMIGVAKRILTDNMGLTPGEALLVVYDESTLKIGEGFFEAGSLLGARTVALRIKRMEKGGMEPFPVVAAAMAGSDVVIAATGASLTHTQARKAACAAGARIATMPGITEEMFFQGPITADYGEVKKLTERVSARLDAAAQAELRTTARFNGAEETCVLTMSLEGRRGIVSSGVYRNRGEGGNLPTGEAYIAPLEGSAEGEVLIDGSFVGLGVLATPLKLTFEGGLLVRAQGEGAAALEALLEKNGNNGAARNLAELGIGTNDKARVTGIILEDEKIYGSVHIALGSNDTFGGKTAAGLHLDAVMRAPELFLDGEKIVAGGQVLEGKYGKHGK